jgi:hypothetical protein
MLNSERADMWRELERQAHEQTVLDLDRLERTPLEFGAHIAWSECLLGRTNGFSPVHRVGFHQVGNAYATCGELIPPPVKWLPLSPAMVRTMMNCRYCEAECARIARGNAA